MDENCSWMLNDFKYQSMQQVFHLIFNESCITPLKLLWNKKSLNLSFINSSTELVFNLFRLLNLFRIAKNTVIIEKTRSRLMNQINQFGKPTRSSIFLILGPWTNNSTKLFTVCIEHKFSKMVKGGHEEYESSSQFDLSATSSLSRGLDTEILVCVNSKMKLYSADMTKILKE